MRTRVMGETARVELLLLLREPVTLVFALALPIVNVVVLGGVFGDQPDPTGEVFREAALRARSRQAFTVIRCSHVVTADWPRKVWAAR